MYPTTSEKRRSAQIINEIKKRKVNSTNLQSETNEKSEACKQRNEKDFMHIDDNDSDSSGSSIHFEDSGKNLKDKLAEWSVVYNISCNALNALLKVLKPEIPDLPSDYRTLKCTPKEVKCVSFKSGQYVHYGVKDSLTDFFEKNIFTESCLDLNINIDGLPLFKSSKVQAWPILININKTESVLVAGVFVGNSKPIDVNEYLGEFVTELNCLVEEGITYKTTDFIVRVRSFICDAPARSFVLGVKGHSGFYSCIKCQQRGETCQNRIIYRVQDSLPRTDDQFRKRTDTNHHNLTCPLKVEELPINVVNQFAFDYMHIVCLGVVKTFLNGWIKIRNKSYSLSKDNIALLDQNLCSVKPGICKEFARKPRSVSEIDRWKAVEFRQFVLYTGPVVLKGVLTDARYKHFLQLSVAIRILCDKNLCITKNLCAKKLIIEFVKKIPDLYDDTFLKFNFHCLTHLADEVLFYGDCLESFSAFKFESYLNKVKQMVHKGNQVVVQIYNRLVELSLHTTIASTINNVIIKKNSSGIVTSIQSNTLFLSLSPPDNLYMLESKVYQIEMFFEINKILHVQSREVLHLNDFFDSPLKSGLVGITTSDILSLGLSSVIHKIVDTNINKALCLPCSQTFAIFSLLH